MPGNYLYHTKNVDLAVQQIGGPESCLEGNSTPCFVNQAIQCRETRGGGAIMSSMEQRQPETQHLAKKMLQSQLRHPLASHVLGHPRAKGSEVASH